MTDNYRAFTTTLFHFHQNPEDNDQSSDNDSDIEEDTTSHPEYNQEGCGVRTRQSLTRRRTPTLTMQDTGEYHATLLQSLNNRRSLRQNHDNT